MANQVYNTSLKCEGCVNSVRKGLNDLAGDEAWQVDLSGAVKTLSISEEFSIEQLKPIFERVGHNISEQN